MRLVATRRIPIGAELARDVSSGRRTDQPLLRAGVHISEKYRDALIHAGFHAVYINDDLSENITVTAALSAETRDIASRALTKAFSRVSDAEGTISPETVAEMEIIARTIANEIAGDGHSVVALTDLAAADSYTLQHSIDVTAIGMRIARSLFEDGGRTDHLGGRSFTRIEHYLSKLGAGLLLHDVGKVATPEKILNKPGKLDPDEWEVMKRHPVTGVEMLRSERISPLVKSVVRSHHERWDGTGYPDGLAGNDIPHFARIAAVADVFDAVTSARPYRGAAPQHIGHRIINAGVGTQFDREVVAVFNRVVAPYPPGDGITLSDGRRGVVMSCPSEQLDRPTVRIGFDADGNACQHETVDLRERPELLPGGGPERGRTTA